jgi:outer membrane receptor for ferric coprogen and ferric-rhodotorulic acid
MILSSKPVFKVCNTQIAQSLKQFKKSSFLLGVMSLCLATGSTQAAEVDENSSSEISMLPTIQVSAEKSDSYTVSKTNSSTGLSLSLKETPQSVSVITRQQLDDTNAQTIGDVLGQATGITFNELDNGARTTYRARGFDIKNYKVDGLNIVGGSDFSGAGNSINMDLYDQVSIVRGANGLLGGSGDPSATIDLVRKLPQKELAGSLKLRTGSWDKKSAVGDINLPLTQDGSVRSRLVVSAEDSDSFRERENIKRTGILASVATDVSDNTVIGAGFQYEKSNMHGSSWGTNVPIWFADGSLTNFSRKFNPVTDWSRTEREGKTFFTFLESQLANDWKLKANYAYTDSSSLNNSGILKVNGSNRLGYPHWNQDGTGAYLNAIHSENDSKNHALSLDVSGPFQLFSREHELLLGLNGSELESTDWTFNSPANCSINGVKGFGNCQYRVELPANWQTWQGNEYPDFVTYRTGAHTKTTTTLVGGYAATRLSLMDDLSLIAGVRRSFYQTYKNNYNNSGELTGRDAKNLQQVWTPYYGLVYNLTPTYSVYASYTDVFNPQTQQKQNGDILDPIIGQSYEAGIKGAWFDNNLNASLAVFDSKQKNNAVTLIGEYVNGDASKQAYAEGSGQRTRGFETEISGSITPEWNLYAGYTYLDIKKIDDDGLLGDPKHVARLRTTYDLSEYVNGLRIGGGTSWQSKIDNVPNPGRPLGNGKFDTAPLEVKGYALFDVMASYQINKNLSANLNVSNLFDKTYYRQYGFYNGLIYGEPRRFTLSLQAQF